MTFPPKPDAGFPVLGVEDELRQRLIDLIQASDPIRDAQTHEERRRLLEAPGAISAEPALELAPSYVTGPRLRDIGLPPDMASVLEKFAKNPALGMFDPPYLHQAEAYRAILTDMSDVLVASGTGSGKTETFLYPILARLAIDASSRPGAFAQPGMRALILYPMNALVSDQIARLRRLFGTPSVRDYFFNLAGIPARFGMYTGRTPYPGRPTLSRSREELSSIIRYFLQLEEGNLELYRSLQERGRVPAKDLRAIAEALEARSEKPLTQARDVELLTRHEMQTWCPHVLVTNYSMLEYMLMRPIERPIFEQSRALYEEDRDRCFLVVLDEAHLYRGVAGGEVSFLLRRLLARLALPRDRVQFILTSASMGDDTQGLEAAGQFVDDLIGTHSNSRGPLRIISGTLAAAPIAPVPPRSVEAKLAHLPEWALAELDSDENFSTQLLTTLEDIGIHVDPASADTKATELARAAQVWAPLVRLRALVSGLPKTLAAICQDLFPELSPDEARSALQNLIEIGGRACVNGQSLLPVRLHLFFRGIPPVFACINPACSSLEGETRSDNGLGKLYVSPRLQCHCGARTYELLIHRDCGARFLRVFEGNDEGDFFWHEGGRSFEGSRELTSAHLLIDDPHRDAIGSYQQLHINIWTGQAQSQVPKSNLADWRIAYRPDRRSTPQRNRPSRSPRYAPPIREDGTAVGSFTNCPACNKRNGGRYIRSLGTIGDRPFATLVREQLLMQAGEIPSETKPNGGRKSLIFSDGRQRAARLARDLPREIEQDGFRQAILLGAQRLLSLGIEPTLDRHLYAAFVSVCSDFHLTFFDREGDAQLRLAESVSSFRRLYGELGEVEFDEIEQPIDRFRLALFRQVGDPNFSLHQINVGFIAPSKRRMRRLLGHADLAPLQSVVGNDIEPLINRWIQHLLDRGAFDPGLGQSQRLEVRKFPDLDSSYPIAAALPKGIVELLGGVDDLDIPTRLLQDALTGADANGARHLDPSKLAVRIAIQEAWWRCEVCWQFFVAPILGRCSQCGSSSIEECLPNDPIFKARADYFRSSIQRVLTNGERPVNLVVEEHTAQLSHRDRSNVWATTEEHELRFQDLRIRKDAPPIDILSCTTTMEVGIDIGSLNAVGLGNVPPQRENYQQRAGRAGRRNARSTTVLTYARDNAHDAHFFANTAAMVAGPPRKPRIDADNPRIASRHINALLIQSFFHRDATSKLSSPAHKHPSDLFSSLGTLREFFSTDGTYSFSEFKLWLENEPPSELVPETILERVSSLGAPEAKSKYLQATVMELLRRLDSMALDSEYQLLDPKRKLLDALFDAGLLPSYAFPTDLCSFVIQKRSSERGTEIEQRPQQDKLRALSEYAPGRKLIVNKRTYTVGGVFIDGVGKPDERFQRYFETALSRVLFCPNCTFISTEIGSDQRETCPICLSALQERATIDPPAFSPKGGQDDAERDTAPNFTTASQAQFPIPLKPESFEFEPAGENLKVTFKRDQRLVVSNTGREDRGFLICSKCGAIEPRREDQIDLDEHKFPFLGLKGYPVTCNGRASDEPIALSHQFSTDLLLIRGKLTTPLVITPTTARLQDALRSLAEGFGLASSYLIDADPGELAAGYRFLPSKSGSLEFEIFIYDAASGGAGYALEVGEQFEQLLDDTEKLLASCHSGCDRSCTRCLRHYGNLIWHEQLDRHLASSLLGYLRYGAVPQRPAQDDQTSLLSPLKEFLELEGNSCHLVATTQPAMQVTAHGRTRTVTIRPSLIAGEPVEHSGAAVSICEYALTRNLPSVAARIV